MIETNNRTTLEDHDFVDISKPMPAYQRLDRRRYSYHGVETLALVSHHGTWEPLSLTNLTTGSTSVFFYSFFYGRRTGAPSTSFFFMAGGRVRSFLVFFYWRQAAKKQKKNGPCFD
jgi:hypothetical protein